MQIKYHNTLYYTHIIHMIIKYTSLYLIVIFSSSVMPRNLTGKTFVRIESRILMLSHDFFWVWDYRIWRFTNFERKYVGVEQVINSSFWQEMLDGNKSTIHRRIWVALFKNLNNFSCFKTLSEMLSDWELLKSVEIAGEIREAKISYKNTRM